MSADACVRWASLSDREALGESLSAEESMFASEHAASCAACRAEAEVWGELESLVDAPAPRAAPLPRTRTRVAIVLAASLAAAAAVIVLVQRTGPRPVDRAAAAVPASAAPAPPAVPATSVVTLSSASGGVVEIDGRAAALGQPLVRGSVLFARDGAACLALEPAVRACVERGSLVRVADTGAQRRLELLGGRIVAELDPQPAGTSFGVLTRDGSAIAIGTAFSVEVPAGSAPVVTRVLHGTVLVRSTVGAEQQVTAHETTSMTSAHPSPLPESEEHRDRLLLTPAPAAAGSQPPPPSLAPPPPAEDPAQLLVAARERRARGDLEGARAAYGTLLAHHAGTPEAHASLVPFGELQLGGLGDARGALASFDRYLAQGGPLDEEASFGRIRALRALGDAAGERAAITSFLHRFPDGLLAPSLRERLRSRGDR